MNGMLRQLKDYWLTVAFGLGFVTDLILLNKIDDLIDNLILLFYVTLATTSLLIFYKASAEGFSPTMSARLKRYTPVVMQYSFGGLLSGMLIFYGRSGDLLTSAPLLLLIVAVIFGNEFLKKNSERLIFHVTLYYIGLFLYIVLVVPVVLGRMGDGIFILSGAISLVLVLLVMKSLFRIVPNFMAANTRAVIVTIGFIYLGFNVLYFTRVIPPIPLSLTELSINHNVTRGADGNYRITSETQSWLRQVLPLPPVLNPSESYIYCFARVYAPTRLSTDIYHQWAFKNDAGDWVDGFRRPYNVNNANDGGFRGYTQTANFSEGQWRCSVETENGQVLGRTSVLIDLDRERGELVTRVE